MVITSFTVWVSLCFLFYIYRSHIYLVGSSLVYWAGRLESHMNIPAKHRLQPAKVQWMGRAGAGVRDFTDLLSLVR